MQTDIIASYDMWYLYWFISCIKTTKLCRRLYSIRADDFILSVQYNLHIIY